MALQDRQFIERYRYGVDAYRSTLKQSLNPDLLVHATLPSPSAKEPGHRCAARCNGKRSLYAHRRDYAHGRDQYAARISEHARVTRSAQAALVLLDDAPPMAYWPTSGLSFLMEAIFGLHGTQPSKHGLKLRKRAMTVLNTFAKTQRIGRPMHSLWSGRLLLQKTSLSMH